MNQALTSHPYTTPLKVHPGLLNKFDINTIISQLPKIFSSSEIDEKVELKLKEKLKITVKDISNRFDEKVNKLRENLSKHIIGTETSLSKQSNQFANLDKEIKDLIQKTKANLQEKMLEEHKMRQRDVNDIISSSNSMRQSLELRLNQIIDHHKNYEESIFNLGRALGVIMEILHLDSTLERYDEEDKQSIALWGTHDKKSSAASDYTKANSKI